MSNIKKININSTNYGIEGVTDTTLAISGMAADAKATGDQIGNLSDLQTADKTDLVSAINEAAQTGGATYGLPRMNIDGDLSLMTTSKNEVTYPYTWIDGDDFRTGWIVAKLQGNSSLAYPKKNYTFKFYDNADVTKKDKCSFFGFPKKSKWVAKANYIDHSHARNIISARLWGDVVKTRGSALPSGLVNSPNYGATNGYPFEIYNNGSYWGLYTLIIPKDDWMFGMDEDNPLHCVLQGATNNDGNNSLTLATEFRNVSISGWECEMPDTLLTSVRDGFLAVISFVLNSSDADFKAGLNSYIDVESAIDYYLFAYFIGASDSLAKNLAMLTYDGGTKWYCSYWDMDSTWGLYWNGSNFYPATMACPEDYQETNSLLWQRLETCFYEELIERYTELRSTVLKLDYINRMFEQFYNSIGAMNYLKDVQKWTSIPQKNVNHLNQIETWAASRAVYVDAQILSLDPTYVPCTGITLDKSSYTLSEDYSVILTATPTPANTQDVVLWSSSDTSVAVVLNDGVVTKIGTGTAVITVTCGNYSDTCTITVPSETVPSLTWTDNSTIDASGNVVSGNAYVSDMVNLNDYSTYALLTSNGFNYVRYAYYNESDDSLILHEERAAGISVPIIGFPDTKVRVGAFRTDSSAAPSNILTQQDIEFVACSNGQLNDLLSSVSYVSGKEIFSLKPKPVEGGSAYILTGNGTVTYLSIIEYDASGSYLRKTASVANTNPVNQTLGADCAFVRIHCFSPTTKSTITDQTELATYMTLTKDN